MQGFLFYRIGKGASQVKICWEELRNNCYKGAENEIRKNIQIIAEGHLDLSRKLDAALKVEEEKEMLLIRTNVLESDVRMLKSKIDTLCSAG